MEKYPSLFCIYSSLNHYSMGQYRLATQVLTINKCKIFLTLRPLNGFSQNYLNSDCLINKKNSSKSWCDLTLGIKTCQEPICKADHSKSILKRDKILTSNLHRQSTPKIQLRWHVQESSSHPRQIKFSSIRQARGWSFWRSDSKY